MTDGGWPPPHPSPPLPPPREYGVPGTSPSRLPYVLGGGAVLVVVLVVVLLVALLGGGDDEPAPAAGDDTPDETPAASSEAPAAPAYTCWDGAAATALEECTAPTGEAGLAWVFPSFADARCGKAAAAGGATTRVLCIARTAAGTKVQLGFFEWPGVEQGQAFYDTQGLTRADAGEVVTWSGAGKSATMYAAAPFSVTVTYPAEASVGPDDLAAFAPRPAAELTGVPAA